jgi:hypothetical protein
VELSERAEFEMAVDLECVDGPGWNRRQESIGLTWVSRPACASSREVLENFL